MDIKKIKDEFQEFGKASGFVTNVLEASSNDMVFLVLAKRGMLHCLSRILSAWEVNQKPHTLKKIFEDMKYRFTNHIG